MADKTPALTTIDESLNTGQRDSGNGDISNSRSCPPLWACAQRLAAVKVQGIPDFRISPGGFGVNMMEAHDVGDEAAPKAERLGRGDP
jgi:hypothetical protein